MSIYDGEMRVDVDTRQHLLSVVIPVYRGAATLPGLVSQLTEYTESHRTSCGAEYRIAEVLLVYDHGPDDSASVIRQLEVDHPFVRAVWLSRNFGQHAATLAGMASSAAEWIVTMDEDGQHDPSFIGDMLDVALHQRSAVVYAAPTNLPPHGRFRNASSRTARFLFVRLLSTEGQPAFNSFRLMTGEIGRSVAAYAGSGVYLDVGLGWVTQAFATCPVTLRDEGDRRSGYSTRALLSHFWRLVLTSGTRPMRAMSAIGAGFAAIGFVAVGVVLIGRLTGAISVAGWASLAVFVLVGFGLVLFSLGIVAEYIGILTQMALGKPPFLVVGDPVKGPLGSGRDDS